MPRPAGLCGKLQISRKFNAGIGVAPKLPRNEVRAVNEIITLALIVLAVPIIALIIFLNFAKPKRRRRRVDNFRA